MTSAAGKAPFSPEEEGKLEEEEEVEEGHGPFRRSGDLVMGT